ncbi:uncharacterized mitochondrial protein AtMg00820-like [Arachis stenosperma]|uniref:uncharacterized mitochondrial protein AtMg00820-like n=1 Tax=Arachis stenosperma TaxID=217475 RepID=UPI0025ACD829|nr:uncharacterized mitochondrial protein AtMg00820-like [Arachis stenosperma]
MVNLASTSLDTLPKSVSEALATPHWRRAMEEEYSALIKNGTWHLVDLPQHSEPIGCKWVFRIKKHPDGTIYKYKARLVAKGFHQRQGIDYDQIFSPVVRLATIRVMLSVAPAKG